MFVNTSAFGSKVHSTSTAYAYNRDLSLLGDLYSLGKTGLRQLENAATLGIMYLCLSRYRISYPPQWRYAVFLIVRKPTKLNS